MAETIFIQRVARGQLQQISNIQSLEADRLLKSVADAQTSTLCDIQPGDIFTVQQQTSGSRSLQAGNNFGQRGFPAAVGTGDHRHPAGGNGEIDAVQYCFSVWKLPDDIFQRQHMTSPCLIVAFLTIYTIIVTFFRLLSREERRVLFPA